MVLGGYDAAKVAGSNITLPFAPSDDCACGYVITVTDIKMNLRNGSNISIIGQSGGSSLKACIDGDGPIIITEDIWWAFTNITGVSEIGRSMSALNYWAMLIPADGAYDGDLTFSIYPDLEITIPNHQLVVPDVEITSEGQEVISKYSAYAEIRLDSLPATQLNGMPKFGRSFLGSAYLLVDNDHGQFTLWASKQSKTADLLELGPPACRARVATSVPTSAPTSPPSSFAGSKPIKAIIAGGIIGGLVAVFFFCGVYYLHKRRQQKREQAGPVIDTTTYVDILAYNKAEMPADRQPPQELSLVRNLDYAPVLHELPQEAAHELPSALPENE